LERLRGALGVVVIMAIAWALCPRARRRAVNLRTIGAGMIVLIVFSFIVLKTPASKAIDVAGEAVNALLRYSDAGAFFVFRALAIDKPPWGFVFAFKVLPTIIFFAALMSILYYVGLMPFIIRMMGRALARFMRTSGAESFSTASDVFVGQTEAPLAIRPYISKLTDSELFACMVAGFATTAGGVLAAYVGMLQNSVPGVAGHLIACSAMAAPASLVIAKLMMPETGEPQTMGLNQMVVAKNGVNVFDALVGGTTDGLKLAVNVGAMLIAFTALVAMLNGGIGLLGEHVFDLETPLTLERILGWIFSPLAWVIGVPADDVMKVGSLLGQKTVVNEFVAYEFMGERLKADAAWLSDRGKLITSYALCGFANFASIGIQVGGYGALAPERRGDLSRLALRAMVAGALTTCMVAAIAGIFL
jgi:CNT family concentrative nucleoside transporter